MQKKEDACGERATEDEYLPYPALFFLIRWHGFLFLTDWYLPAVPFRKGAQDVAR